MTSLLNNHNSSVQPKLYRSKSSQKKYSIPYKRKILISPSKDLLLFFRSTNPKTFNESGLKEKSTNTTKLTLNTKESSTKKISLQKKIIETVQPSLKQKLNKQINKQNTPATSLLNKINHKHNKNQKPKLFFEQQKDQKILRLKKQVDQIRRKYSYNKIKPPQFSPINQSLVNSHNQQQEVTGSSSFFLKKNKSQIVLRQSSKDNKFDVFSPYNVNAQSNQQSKEKLYFTPIIKRHDKNRTETSNNSNNNKKLTLKSNIFQNQQANSRSLKHQMKPRTLFFKQSTTIKKPLKLTQKTYSSNQQALKQNDSNYFISPYASTKRKHSFQQFNTSKITQQQLKNIYSNIQNQIQTSDSSNKKTFQFTFGSMALMDFHNQKDQKDNNMKLSLK